MPRLTVLTSLTAGYAGIFVAIVLAFRRYLARQPRPFVGLVAGNKVRPRMYSHEN